MICLQTPRIEAATSDQKVNEVSMEGVLNCKVAVVDGKVCDFAMFARVDVCDVELLTWFVRAVDLTVTYSCIKSKKVLDFVKQSLKVP